MKNFKTPLVFLFTLSTLLFSCSSDDNDIYLSEKSEIVSFDNVTYSPIETEILNLVNDHRTTLGLSKLITLNAVSGVADSHTDYMIEIGEVNHDNFPQRSETLKNQVNALSVGENVAYGYNSAQAVFKGWLNSEGHRKIVEDPKYTHFGISTDSDSNNRNYFTQIFIKK